MNLLTCFKILGLPSDVDAARAKRAYKAQVRRWHPDQFPAGSDAKAAAEEQLKQINVAYARIKEYLADRQPAADIRATDAPSRPDRGHKSAEKQTQTEKRSWVDILFKTLNTFVGDRRDPSSPPPPGKHSPDRKPSFGQVLDEMTGGRIARPKKHRVDRSDTFRQNAAGYRRKRRSGSTVDAVGGPEHPGPVRPVGRVRGIGKPR